jgi:hypothetical protein
LSDIKKYYSDIPFKGKSSLKQMIELREKCYKKELEEIIQTGMSFPGFFNQDLKKMSKLTNSDHSCGKVHR